MRIRVLIVAITMAMLVLGCASHTSTAKKTAPPTRPKVTTTTTSAATSSTAPAPPPTSPPPAAYRFNQTTGECTPALMPAISRNWQVSAPGPSPQTSVMIGLRNKMEGPTAMESAAGVTATASWALPAPDASLTARITTPAGAIYTSQPTGLLPTPPTSWIYLSYTSDFPDAPTPAPGTYTIVWTTPTGPVACYGFTIT